MKKILFILIGLVFIQGSSLPVFSQSNHHRDLLASKFSKDDMLKIYNSKTLWKPFPGYEDRDAWSNLPEIVKKAHLKAAEEALDYSWPILPATLYLEYARSGNRSNFQTIYFERRSKLANLVIGEMIEGKGRYIDQILNGIWAICEESTWCIPAHISAQSIGFTPLPTFGEDVVDLFAAETGTTLSWTWYFLKDQLEAITPVIVQRMEHEINKRILRPVLERDDFWWMGLGERNIVNNWNPWIISNWITCALIMEEDTENKAASLAKAMACLDNFLNVYPDDGGCDEGPGYWGHAGGSLFDCLELLYNSSDGQIDIYTDPLVRNIGSYIYKVYISGTYYINFADASGKTSIYPDIVYRYGKRTDNPTMMGFAALKLDKENYETGSYIMGRKLYGLFSYDEIASYPATEPLVADFWLPETEIFGARSEEGSDKGLYLAGKGGHNAESHNHNDVGNYIVYFDGKPVLIDVGVEEYRRETFSDQRYSIWTMQSQYHTLPTINGVMQKEGREFRARDVSFNATTRTVNFTVDLAGAYPETAGVHSWNRSIKFQRGKYIQVNEDYNLSKVDGPSFLSFMTPCQVEVGEEGKIDLMDMSPDNPFHMVLDYDAKQFSVETEKIQIEDPRLLPVWGEGLTRIRLILRSPDTTGKIRYTIKPD